MVSHLGVRQPEEGHKLIVNRLGSILHLNRSPGGRPSFTMFHSSALGCWAGGDCCVSTCVFNKFVRGSCAPKRTECRDPGVASPATVYVNPPAPLVECTDLQNTPQLLTVINRTVLTAGNTPCRARFVTTDKLNDNVVVPVSSCPGNFDVVRNWRVSPFPASSSACSRDILGSVAWRLPCRCW
jgi:hypothetical protein